MLKLELEKLEFELQNVISGQDKLNLKDFLQVGGKRLRPRVIFLVLKMKQNFL